MFKLPFTASDDFGYSVNDMAESMDSESKLELAKEHYAACDRRDQRRMLLWVLALAASILLWSLGVPHIPFF